MGEEELSGKMRKLGSIIEPYQQRFVEYAVPKLPKWIETYHLTFLTFPLSILMVMVGYLSRDNIVFIPLVSLLIFAQYVSDILDGALGRYRDTGLVRWGFYMDHFFDYLFTCSLVASYSLAYGLSMETFLTFSFLTSGFFVHEFLMANTHGSLNTSGYYGVGPTELRFVAIVTNLLLPFLPRGLFIRLFDGFMPLFILAFGYIIFRGQKKLWKMDMQVKRDKEDKKKK